MKIVILDGLALNPGDPIQKGSLDLSTSVWKYFFSIHVL